jgi:putative DNA primase/helicase
MTAQPFIDDGDDAKIAPIYSEEALALQFAKVHREELRFVAVWNHWLIYDGLRWCTDEVRKAFSLAREICRAAANAVNKKSDGKNLAKAKTRAAVLSLASDDQRLAATSDQWDADLWLLNTPDGVIDLRTGEMREHRPEDYMTKITAVTPDKSCPTPLWDAFLSKVTQGDEEFQAYLARMCGYGLTGITREHALFFLYGPGGNGKGTFILTVSGVQGDYHRAAPIETFTEGSVDRHPTELAMLRGARLVTSEETEEGRRWAESRIKMLTGGGEVSARFMRQDFFEYMPQFKLVIAGNNKPGLRSANEAIRRRFNLLPFTVIIPEAERDENLVEKLKAEWPGILAWMIAGCLDWQKKGLAPPKIVTDATEEYLQGEDNINAWLDECCAKDAKGWTSSGDLFSSWKDWAEAAGEYVISKKRLGQQLEDRGFVPIKKRPPATATTATAAAQPSPQLRGYTGLTLLESVGGATDENGYCTLKPKYFNGSGKKWT